MKDDTTAQVIKVAAVLTATPRWVAALLGAEGFALPQDWLTWWVPASAVLSAGMAVVEGFAFAYVFQAWRNQDDRKSDNLLRLAALSAAIFVIVLAPYIAASVRHVALAAVLAWPPALWLWSAAVAASTITIVVSVGYAQRVTQPRRKAEAPAPVAAAFAVEPAPALPEPAAEFACLADGCGRSFARQTSLAAHMRVHALTPNGNGHKG